MKKPTLKVQILFLLVSIAVTGCTKSAPVLTKKAERKSIEEVITGVNSGTVLAEQDTELAFGSVGRVSALHISLGDTVKKGDVLAELENDDLKTTLSVALKEESRQNSLKDIKAVSSSEIDKARQVRSLATVALEKTFIRAPFDGFIAELNLEVGQLAQITAVLPKPPIRLVDTTTRYIKVQFDEIDLVKIKEGTRARIKLLASRSEPFEGVVRRVIPYISSIKEQDRTAEIEVTINASTLLPVGASADVELILNKKEGALVVPTKSVLGNSTGRFLYLFKDNKAIKTSIKAGITNFDQIEVLEGIGEQDLVIVPDDKNAIKDGQSVTIRES
jgi:HlyD family secretion protein